MTYHLREIKILGGILHPIVPKPNKQKLSICYYFIDMQNLLLRLSNRPTWKCKNEE